jgi:hypothetical protein
MYDSYEEGESWNMAQAYYKRIDELLTLADKYQIEDRLEEWYKVLYCLYKEIRGKTIKNKEDRKKLDKEMDDLKGAIKEARQKGTVERTMLVKFELHLRDILESKSMLTPKSDDPTKAYRNAN